MGVKSLLGVLKEGSDEVKYWDFAIRPGLEAAQNLPFAKCRWDLVTFITAAEQVESINPLSIVLYPPNTTKQVISLVNVVRGYKPRVEDCSR